MKIGLIGAGRLGICLALLIERAGFDVIASDVREDYVERFRTKSSLQMNHTFKIIFLNQKILNLQLTIRNLLMSQILSSLWFKHHHLKMVVMM